MPRNLGVRKKARVEGFGRGGDGKGRMGWEVSDISVDEIDDQNNLMGKKEGIVKVTATSGELKNEFEVQIGKTDDSILGGLGIAIPAFVIIAGIWWFLKRRK